MSNKKLLNTMYRINEDVAKSKKVLKEIDSLEISSDEIDKLKRVVEKLKEYLVKNNSVGYLGAFTQMLYNMAKRMYFSDSFERRKYKLVQSDDNGDKRINKGQDFKVSDVKLTSFFISAFKKIKENNDIIKNLRNINGDLIKIEDCPTLSNLEYALTDLGRWRIFNNFIKSFPKAQKDLIWENGYFIKSIKPKDRYALYNSVEDIIKLKREDVFLRKVSNIKNTQDMVDKLIDMGKAGLPWDVEDYLEEINKSKDVDIVYNEKNYLILKIESAKGVKKYCNDTAWCIKDLEKFIEYNQNSDFFAVFNFNKNFSDKMSKVGITYSDKTIYHCADKFDKLISPNEIGLGDIRNYLDDGNLDEGNLDEGMPWSIKYYLEEIDKSKDVSIIYNEKNYLILKIKSAKEIQKYCGDTDWSIKDQATFINLHRNADFFAVLNFNKNSSDSMAKVGITYSYSNRIQYCHDKFDSPVSPNEIGLGDIRNYLGGSSNSGKNIFTKIKNWLDSSK
jgi:hypothetical protein